MSNVIGKGRNVPQRIGSAPGAEVKARANLLSAQVTSSPAGWAPAAGRRAPAPGQVGGGARMTQAGANLEAGRLAAQAETRLQAAERLEGRAPAGLPTQEARAESVAFREYAQAASGFAGSAVEGGSLQAHVKASTLSSLLNQRSEAVERRNGDPSSIDAANPMVLRQAGMLAPRREELEATVTALRARLPEGSPRRAAFEASQQKFEHFLGAAGANAAQRSTDAGDALGGRATRGAVEAGLIGERISLLQVELQRMAL